VDASEVVEQPSCPAQGETINDHGDRALCLLYNDHPGGHSFEF
jgi:hypothetical protein